MYATQDETIAELKTFREIEEERGKEGGFFASAENRLKETLNSWICALTADISTIATGNRDDARLTEGEYKMSRQGYDDPELRAKAKDAASTLWSFASRNNDDRFGVAQRLKILKFFREETEEMVNTIRAVNEADGGERSALEEKLGSIFEKVHTTGEKLLKGIARPDRKTSVLDQEALEEWQSPATTMLRSVLQLLGGVVSGKTGSSSLDPSTDPKVIVDTIKSYARSYQGELEKSALKACAEMSRLAASTKPAREIKSFFNVAQSGILPVLESYDTALASENGPKPENTQALVQIFRDLATAAIERSRTSPGGDALDLEVGLEVMSTLVHELRVSAAPG